MVGVLALEGSEARGGAAASGDGAADGAGAGEPAVLRRLVGHLMAPAAPALGHLDPPERFALQATYFLLDVDTAGGTGATGATGAIKTKPTESAETFVTWVLERLLRRLRHTTEQRQVELQDRVRGRVVWPATYKARLGGGYTPALHVCREVRHRFDTPENRLLKYVVERLHECIQAVPAALRTGACYLPATGGRSPLGTHERLARMETALRSFRLHPHLREVVLLPRLDDGHVQRAEAARVREYAAAALIYRRYRALVLSPAWPEHVVAAGRRALPLPGSVTPEGDRWIRLGAAVLRAPA
jgi:hypothetical protein